MLRNSFYYIPKNSLTFEAGYNQLNKYFYNNPFRNIGFDFELEINKPFTNIYYETNKNKKNMVHNYKLIHYHNNRLHTMLHLYDLINDIDIKEFFYVKPHIIYQDIAKIDYALIYNNEKVYNFNFDILYNEPYYKYKNAIFDKYRLYKMFSKKYLV